MKTILIIALTILVYQTLNLIVYLASEENEEALVISSIGVYVLIGFVYGKIKLIISRKYNLYQFFGSDGKWLRDFYMTPKTANRFKTVYGKNDEVKENYSIRLLKEGKEFKTAPYECEILIDNDLTYGFAGFTIDFFQNFLKEG